MQNLTIMPTGKTPEVNFQNDEGILNIKGRCYPENPDNFFKPLLAWVKSYQNNPSNQTVFTVDLEYYNTNSSRCLMLSLDMLKTMFEKGMKVKVEWSIYEDSVGDYDDTLEKVLKERYPFIEFVYKS